VFERRKKERVFSPSTMGRPSNSFIKKLGKTHAAKLGRKEAEIFFY
jgi:hypothetical protein